MPPDYSSTDGDRPDIFSKGPPPFIQRYNQYWQERGIPAPTLPRGTNDPVQTFAPQEEVESANDDARQAELDDRLRLACQTGGLDLDGVEKLVKDGANPNAGDDNGWVALHQATRAGRKDMIALLVRLGAALDIRTGVGPPALFAQKIHGADHPVTQLLIKLESGRVNDVLAAIASQTSLDDELRAQAKTSGSVARLTELIGRGANIHSGDLRGWTAIHEAARAGRIDLIKLLMEHGAVLDERTTTPTGLGGTPLYWAIEEHGPDHEAPRYIASLTSSSQHDEL